MALCSLRVASCDNEYFIVLCIIITFICIVTSKLVWTIRLINATRFYITFDYKYIISIIIMEIDAMCFRFDGTNRSCAQYRCLNHCHYNLVPHRYWDCLTNMKKSSLLTHSLQLMTLRCPVDFSWNADSRDFETTEVAAPVELYRSKLCYSHTRSANKRRAKRSDKETSKKV